MIFVSDEAVPFALLIVIPLRVIRLGLELNTY